MTRQAAIYARISRDRAGAGLGVDRQIKDCRKLAGEIGWTVAGEYTDNDLSAYSGKPRPGYLALLNDLREGRVNAVIAWHTDRLHRSPAELEEYITACEATGAPTHAVQAGPLDLTTPAGRMVARHLGAAARYEVELQIERVRGEKAQAAESGRYRGGRRPFGYESDGRTICEPEAAVLRDLCERVLVGESLRSLTRELNDRGVCTSTGGQWSTVSLREVVKRARNFGRIERHGEILEGVTAEWPPIVDEDTGRAVRAMLSDPARQQSRSSDLAHLGSGEYRCGVCADGTIMRAGRTRRGQAVYLCGGSTSHLSRACDPVDELVTAAVIRRLSAADAHVLLHVDGESPGELHEQAGAARARLNELAGLFAERDITGAQLAEASRRLKAQLEDLERRLAVAVAGSPLAGFADAEDVGAAWTAASVSRRKAVVRALCTVTVHRTSRGRHPGGGYFDPASVAIEWIR